jgi:hypothetical protein
MSDKRIGPGTAPLSIKGQDVRLFKTVRVRDFRELQDAVKKVTQAGRRPAFRGYQVKAGDKLDYSELVTGLERSCMSTDHRLDQARKREIALIRKFVRRAHHYLSDDVPD